VPEQAPKEGYPKVNRNARVTGILRRIVETKRDEVARLGPRRRELRQAAEAAGPARALGAALARRGEVAVIAEYKRQSPSAGMLGVGDPVEAALAYEAGGAAAISVLTDGPFFGGALDDLVRVRAAVGVPVLRKDFTVDDAQVWEARAAGADGVLLIARILEPERLRSLLELAGELAMAALVEVHDERELERALAVDAKLVGVNNRDLDTLTTDLGVTARLASSVPADRVLVGESGIRGPADVDLLGAAGVDAVLVGEALMRGTGVASIVGRRGRQRAELPVRRACSC
jgi:indole-3-glycerol phosphate synthase